MPCSTRSRPAEHSSSSITPRPAKEQAKAHGFNPDDYVSPADVAAMLDDQWRIEVDEIRPRNVTTGAGSAHTQDIVLRAHRLT